MKTELVYIDGEPYISFHTIAECYECSVSWVAEVYEYGLLGEGRPRGGAMLVTSNMLDRVARVRQLSIYHGLELEVIAVLLHGGDERSRS